MMEDETALSIIKPYSFGTVKEKSIAIDEIINNKFNTKTFHYDES